MNPTVLLVDMANVLGSRPDGWWHDRAAATGRLIDRLTSLVGTEVTGPDGHVAHIERIVAVLEGTARASRPPTAAAAGTAGTAPAAPEPASLEIVHARRDGDSTVVEAAQTLLAHVRAGPAPTPALLVVTADRGLRQRLPIGVTAAGPDWLNGLIGR